MLYQFWHLCQYGGLRRHIPMLALGIIGLVGTVVLWLISKRHNQEVNSGDNGNKKLFYTEMILLIAATLFFGGRIVYSAVPYHGALSWKLDEWMRKKEVELEHNNLFEDGVEGILMDLDEALQLPDVEYLMRIFDEFIQAYFDSQFVQSLTLNDFRTCIGQESFPFTFEVLIDNISYDGVKDGVTEEFQAFIVQRTSFFRTYCR